MNSLNLLVNQNVFLFRCKIPGYANDTWEIHSEEQRELVKRYIPPSDSYPYDRCHIYAFINDSHRHEHTGANRSEVKCNEWVYDTSVFETTFTKRVSLSVYINIDNKHWNEFCVCYATYTISP